MRFRSRRSSSRFRRRRRFTRRSRFARRRFGRRRFGRRFRRGRFGRRRRSARRGYRRKVRRFGRRRSRIARRYRRYSSKARRSGRLPFTLRTITTEGIISKIGLQTWFDIPALGDPIFMMQDLMSDALINLVRIKAARDPIQRIQGLSYPWNLNQTTIQERGAVLQAADIHPSHFYVTFKEIIKYHMYNTSNVTAYITIIKKYPRVNSRETGYGGFQQRLALFPATASDTPLTITSANSSHLLISGNALNWGYPDYADSATPANNPNGSISPFLASAGADLGCLSIPRQYGAFVQMFPTSPWPSFVQQNAQNFFNQGPTSALTAPNEVLTVTTGGYFNENSSTHYLAGNIMAIDELASKASGTGADPTYFRPVVGSNYFLNNLPPSSNSTTAGDQGNRGQAYTTVNYHGNPDFDEAYYDRNPTLAQRQFISGNAGPSGTDSVDSNVGWRPQDDPFGVELGGNGYNWSTHPQYNELKNTVMKRLFRMKARRLTIPPGKVLRWTLRSRRATINPDRDQLIYYATTATKPCVWSGAVNASRTIDGWGSTTSIPNAKCMIECPSLWGPGMPAKTILWSMSVRGQTAQKGSASDYGQIMPTELLLKKDHTVRYKVSYKPVLPSMRKHITNRNFMEYNPLVTNYRIQYPISGAVQTGTTASTVSSVVPSLL